MLLKTEHQIITDIIHKINLSIQHKDLIFPKFNLPKQIDKQVIIGITIDEKKFRI